MIDGVRPFLDALFRGLEAVGVDTRGLFLDHICYRVASVEAYVARKAELERYATLLHETAIGGRPIAAFKLHTPFPYRGRAIPVVELPAPKAGRAYPEGWEHAELVITEPFAALLARHPDLAWDTSATAKAHNPELRLPLGGDLSVKFHHASLEDVIRAEKSAGTSGWVT